MHVGRGVFALLVGSGISRSAKIPTGWEITLDLVRKVAALESVDCGEDPAAWYREKYRKSPDYSDLLEQLATTAPLRQQVIKPYIEPNESERERGDKLPTAAHRAIAAMVSRGYVRIIITTNFDRLLEQALSDLGVQPHVLSSNDHVAGSVPLVHAGPTIIKVNGDYLDTRIRNTSGELSGYEPALDRLLDQVFDAFGIVLCGWSADWDIALKAAIDRAPARRYPTYWAARGEPSGAAVQLIDRRAARIVPITGVDEFFDELAEKIQVIETLSKPHPLSADVAVAMLKEYLPEPRHRIKLHSLLTEEISRALPTLDSTQFSTNAWSSEIFASQVAKYEAAVGILVPLAYTAGMWSDEEQTRFWADALASLAARIRNVGGQTPLIHLRAYPASLLLYAFGLGTIVGRRSHQLGALVGEVVNFGELDGKRALGDRLNASVLIAEGGQDRFRSLDGYGSSKLAASDRIADVLRPVARNDLRDELAFDKALGRLELALSFGFAERSSPPVGHFWAPTGRIARNPSLAKDIFLEWRAAYQSAAGNCELSVMAALKKAPRFDEVISQYNRHVGLVNF